MQILQCFHSLKIKEEKFLCGESLQTCVLVLLFEPVSFVLTLFVFLVLNATEVIETVPGSLFDNTVSEEFTWFEIDFNYLFFDTHYIILIIYSFDELGFMDKVFITKGILSFAEGDF